MKRGASVGLKLHSFKLGGKVDPVLLYFRQVVFEWARALWEATPKLEILQATFEDAVRVLANTSRP
eukprot:1728715-Pyramimonas_sp.AAC.1